MFCSCIQLFLVLAPSRVPALTSLLISFSSHYAKHQPRFLESDYPCDYLQKKGGGLQVLGFKTQQ